MIPECCKKCTRLVHPDKCPEYKKCLHWRLWFRVEWENLQKLAKQEKEADK